MENKSTQITSNKPNNKPRILLAVTAAGILIVFLVGLGVYMWRQMGDLKNQNKVSSTATTQTSPATQNNVRACESSSWGAEEFNHCNRIEDPSFNLSEIGKQHILTFLQKVGLSKLASLKQFGGKEEFTSVLCHELYKNYNRNSKYSIIKCTTCYKIVVAKLHLNNKWLWLSLKQKTCIS